MPPKRAKTANTKAARKREEKQSRAGEFDEFNGLDENGIEARSDDDEDDRGSDLDGFVVEEEEEEDEDVSEPTPVVSHSSSEIDPSLIIEGKRNRRAPRRYWDEIQDTVQELFQEEEEDDDDDDDVDVEKVEVSGTVDSPPQDEEDVTEPEEVSEYEVEDEEEDDDEISEEDEEDDDDEEYLEPDKKRRRTVRSDGPVISNAAATLTTTPHEEENLGRQDVVSSDSLPITRESHSGDPTATQESGGTSV